jgi:hypothetical protein
VVLLAIGSALLAPWARGADRVGPHGSVYTVDNESGMARTINVAGFPVEAEGNPCAAYSMLLTKGVIRVGIPIPANAEFELVSVHDPYGYAGKNANGNELSLFRRPLPSTNLAFLTAVMWDGRETLQKGSSAAIHFDLADQANAATQGHAQAPNPINEKTRDAIFAYETTLYTS